MVKIRFFTGVLLACLLVVSPALSAVETKATHALVMDHATGVVLFEKNGYQPMYPASMTKMMTAHMMFEALKKGEIKPEDTYPVSENAWSKQGSKMFVQLGNQIKIEDLLKGIVIQSGNDACIVFAEGYAGSEERFAERMTMKAKEIGMLNTVFKNSTGWPDEEHVTTAYDLAVLARSTISEFPEYYPIYAEKEYVYHDIKQYNRNLLLYRDMGIDGLKTGHTEAAGYGITISGVQEGRRVNVVVNGLTSEKERADEAAKLFRYGLAEFKPQFPGKEGRMLAEIPVWYGSLDNVKVTTAEDSAIILPTVDKAGLKAEIVTSDVLKAPIAKGQELGYLEISGGSMSAQKVKLVAAEDVTEASFTKKLVTNLSNLLN